MIAKLTGRVDSLNAGSLVLDVGGVGYLVQCSSRILAELTLGQSVALWIETVMREDRIELFGFLAPHEQEWFCRLTSVQGVGARAGLSILSSLSLEEVTRALVTGDATFFTRAAGVGRKLATRIVAELKDKVDPSSSLAASLSSGEMALPSLEAVSALVNLGYHQAEARGAVARAGKRLGDQDSLDRLISESLKEFGI